MVAFAYTIVCHRQASLVATLICIPLAGIVSLRVDARSSQIRGRPRLQIACKLNTRVRFSSSAALKMTLERSPTQIRTVRWLT
jgi:hypothetical protein